MKTRTIEVSEETYEKIKEQLNEEEKIDLKDLNDFVGKSFFFRTVTYHLIGKVVKIIGDIIELEEASWIPDSGRFMNAIKDGELNEVEPLGQWFINLNACTDFGIWKHKLPKDQQ